MTQTIQKLMKLERDLANRKGEFALFAVLQREEAENKWDLVVSASWLGDEYKNALPLLVAAIQPRLSRSELLSLSRIVVLDPSDRFVEDIVDRVEVEHGCVGMSNCVIHGMRIKEAFIITATKQSLALSPEAC